MLPGFFWPIPSKPNIKLKTLLLEKGMTQRDLAYATGLDEGTVSKAIRHSITTPEIREAIGDYLDVEQSEIFDQRGY